MLNVLAICDCCTVKILKIGTPELLSVTALKWLNLVSQSRGPPKDEDRIANSVDPDQTAPSGAV